MALDTSGAIGYDEGVTTHTQKQPHIQQSARAIWVA